MRVGPPEMMGKKITMNATAIEQIDCKPPTAKRVSALRTMRG
jgi:uncharacterized protein YlzI (FlbEa/FlbD family)